MIQGLDKRSIHHVGFIVKNIDDAVEQFKSFYGISEFQIYDFTPSRVWSYGKEVFGYKLKIAMSVSEDMRTGVEIIQPLSGEGIHKDYLTDGNNGMHHICISADKDYDEWRQAFADRGYRFLFESETEDEVIGYRRCFYAEDPIAGMIIEIKETPYFRK